MPSGNISRHVDKKSSGHANASSRLETRLVAAGQPSCKLGGAGGLGGQLASCETTDATDSATDTCESGGSLSSS